MNTSQRATGYDLFKLIVAILLVILFFLLNRKTMPDTPPPIFTPFSNHDLTAAPASLVTTFISATRGPDDAATAISSPTLTRTLASTATPPPTVTAEATATPLPAATATSTPEPTSTSVRAITSTPRPEAIASSACDLASSHSRLQAGGKAVLLRRLNFRSSPGIQDNWLRTNPSGTSVEVIAGPECLPYISGAYVWWQIKLPDGQVGWSAEASQFSSFYFMEPDR